MLVKLRFPVEGIDGDVELVHDPKDGRIVGLNFRPFFSVGTVSENALWLEVADCQGKPLHREGIRFSGETGAPKRQQRPAQPVLPSLYRPKPEAPAHPSATAEGEA